MVSMRALECLVTIVEQDSLTRAAAVLHVSQPALSHQIAAIERELGTAVIQRLPRGIRPTAAGLAAAAEARVAVAAAGRAVIAGRRVAAGAGGRIRVACAETMTAWVLVPVLRAWRRRFPAVELDLTEYTSADTMLAALLAGGADLAVGPRPTRTDEHVEVLGREEIVVVAAAGHRFAGLARVPLAEVAAGPLVHYHPDNGFAVWVDQFAARRGVVLPRPALRTGSPRTAAQLAAAGMGVTVVPCSALGPLPGATIRPLDPPELREVIAVVAAPHDDLLRRFVADLKRRGLPDSGIFRIAALSGCGLASAQGSYLRPGRRHQFLVGVGVAGQAPASVGGLGQQHPGPAGQARVAGGISGDRGQPLDHGQLLGAIEGA
jgi:DNA-binding transcriptional LysR family regulator